MAQSNSTEYESLTASIASKTDSSVAAYAFTEPTRQTFSAGASESDIESSLQRAWNSLIDVAADISHESQEPLVDIVRSVQQQNVAKEENASDCTIWGEKVKLWKDMPLFGPSLRGAWNRAPGTGSQNDFSAKQWCNVNAFLARLTSLSASIPTFDFSLYAIWTLRSAFEGTGNASSADIDAAKMWFVYANDIIEKLSRDEKTFDGKVARSGDKFKDKEWKGFNTQRLEIWQKALQ